MKSLFKKIIIIILTWEARLVLLRYKPKIVAVTGSVGKTSTKDALYTALAKNFRAWKSEKSFNSEIGVPLAILGLPNGWNNPIVWIKNILKGAYLGIFNFLLDRLGVPSEVAGQFSIFKYPEWLVLEIGADRPGDIEQLAKWLSPDAVVITRFGKMPVHVEFFESVEEVHKEKSFLVSALKDGGLLLLNNDDADVRKLRDLKRQSRAVSFSIDYESDFQASNLEFVYAEKNGVTAPSGITFKVNYNGNSVPMTISGALGRQQVYPVLSALAFGESIGLNMVAMLQSFKEYQTAPGRMRILDGVKNTIVIDDSYNASPVAVAEALRTLRELKTDGKKVAVLGDMTELGKYSVKEHEKVGREASQSADILVTVGVRARDIAKGALENDYDEKNIFQFDTSLEAGKPIENLLSEGDIVLVKGSQAIRMEKVVEEIMSHPEEKEKCLVRQEPEWQKR